jgi:hypothetical protein
MIADIVMSMDNVIAVAAAANGSMLLSASALLSASRLIVTGASLITPSSAASLSGLGWRRAARLDCWRSDRFRSPDQAAVVRAL